MGAGNLCCTVFRSCPIQFACRDFGATCTRPKAAICDGHVALFTRGWCGAEKRCGRSGKRNRRNAPTAYGGGFQVDDCCGRTGPDLLELAEEVAFGRIAYAQKRFSDASEHFARAVAIEDRIPYMEPPFWYYPVRQSLGAAQLAMGQPDAARQSFMAALVRTPNNGWALYGLAESQRQMKDRPALRGTRAALEQAWLDTDRSALQLARL